MQPPQPPRLQVHLLSGPSPDGHLQQENHPVISSWLLEHHRHHCHYHRHLVLINTGSCKSVNQLLLSDGPISDLNRRLASSRRIFTTSSSLRENPQIVKCVGGPFLKHSAGLTFPSLSHSDTLSRQHFFSLKFSCFYRLCQPSDVV